MANTPSNMVPLGTPAPDFSLLEPASGRSVGRDQFVGRPMLVIFMCNHCPFVVHVLDELDRIERDFGERVAIVGINSNSVRTHPQDGPENMKILVAERGWAFPFLFDSTQEVARAYQAACTPDFFVYDADHRLYYRGQLDDTRPGGPAPDGRDLRAALNALLGGDPPPEMQRPSMGCNIKWDT